jgi:hypothetical protein
MKIAARVIFVIGILWVLGLVLWKAYAPQGSPTGADTGVAIVTSHHVFQVKSSEQGLRIVPLDQNRQPVPVQGLSGTAKLVKGSKENATDTPLKIVGNELEAPFDLKGVGRVGIGVEVQGFSDPAEPKAGFIVVYDGSSSKPK